MPRNIDPVKYLIKNDPILASVISRVDMPIWKLESNYFKSLVEAIINQQLSDKAADTIIGRFNQVIKIHPYKPADILKLDKEMIRSAGISYSKAGYILDLAGKVYKGELNLEEISILENEKVIEALISVKGIGRWTAEMFLMFSLGREDVFSYGDLGLKNAIKILYRLKSPPTEKQAEKISSKWRPYRSWACRYLWASLDLDLSQ
jgi:DNA-3-methyladenine glycosylase II